MPKKYLPSAQASMRLDNELRHKLGDLMHEQGLTSTAQAARIAIATGLARLEELEEAIRFACIAEGMREGRAIIRKKMQSVMSQALGELKAKDD